MRWIRPSVLLACVALSGYAAAVVLGDPALPQMILWFLVAVVLRDAVLLPMYTSADRALLMPTPRTRVPTDNVGGRHRVPDPVMRWIRPSVLLACVALSGYAVTIVLGDPALPLMVGWFLAAVVLHDAVLLPMYTSADRALVMLTAHTRVPVVNHFRVPALGAGLTLLLFLPGIIRQGGDTHLAATGLDQQPYLGRWLALVAAIAALSALVYAVRVVVTTR